MSKLIKLTKQFKEECVKEFEKALSDIKLSDGRINFVKSFDGGTQKATVYFTSKAWVKMLTLINGFNDEVAWHGIAERYGDEDKNEYLISDILVYPQTVSGATVNTNQVEYQDWLMSQPDEVFDNIRMQGHSHVNMHTSPSSVDLSHQDRILEQLEDDMFYIFMIWNKSYERHIKIYDLKKNIMFENSDISVQPDNEEDDFFRFYADARDKVKRNNVVYSCGANATANKSAETKKDGGSGKKDKPVTKAKNDSKSKSSYYDDDDDDRYGYPAYHSGYPYYGYY